MITAAILLNYNDEVRNIALARKLKKTFCFNFIIIVDNNSKNSNLLDVLENEGFVILKSKENKGYAAGNNIGFRYLKDKNVDYVLTINSDIDFDTLGIEHCFNFLDNHSELSACSLRMKQKGKIVQNYYKIPSVLSSLTPIQYFKPYAINKKFDGYFTVDYVRESFAFYNYKKFEEIGFYDEDFFLYEEGPSSGSSFKKLGYTEAILDNGEYCYHNHRGPQMNRKNFKIFKKSRLHFLKKYKNASKFKLLLVKIIWINVFY